MTTREVSSKLLIHSAAEIDEAVGKVIRGEVEGAPGPQGPQGIQGPKGDTGATGPKGADGLTTSIQVNGTTYTHVAGKITLPDYPSGGGGDLTQDQITNINKVPGLEQKVEENTSQLDTITADLNGYSFVDSPSEVEKELYLEELANPLPPVASASDAGKILEVNGDGTGLIYTEKVTIDISGKQDKTDNNLNGTDKNLISVINTTKAAIDNHITNHPGVTNIIKEWNVLGDSITDGYGFTPQYHKVIQDALGISKVNNYGISSSIICTGGGTGGVQPMCTRYSSMSPTADLITVLGGVNDFLYSIPLGTITDTVTTTFYGGVKTLIEGLITTFSDATILVLTPTKVANSVFSVSATGTNSIGKTLKDYVNVIKEVCEYYGVPYIDLYNTSGLQPLVSSIRTKYMPDGLHPNVAGHKKVAQALVREYSFSNRIDGTITVVPVTGVTLNKSTITINTGGTDTLTATIAPGNATNKNVTWTTSNSSIATVINGVVTGMANGLCTITCTTVDGSKTATCNVTVQVSTNDPYIEGRLLVFEDNFDGSSIKTTNYDYELGNVRGSRIDTSVENAVSIQNNTLVLTATKGGTSQFTGTRAWTSGAIHTCEKQAYLYGRWEAKIKLPNKYGAFPAFWTCGDRMVRKFDTTNATKSETFIGVPYPWGGEIDIMEQAPGNFGGISTVGACYWKATGSSFTDETVSNYTGLYKKTDVDTTQYHIYAMEWTDTYIEFFVDNVSIGKKTYEAGMDYYKEPQFYILNLAMGSGGGTPETGVTEMKMEVDWVRIYAPTTITSVSPITAIDIENFTTIQVGQTKKLSYTITPSNVGNRALKWRSSDDSICTAYGGYLIPKKAGTVTVTVTTANGITDAITVNCTESSDVVCTGIQLNKTTTSLPVGTGETLTVSYTPTNTTQKSITWSSSNTAIATVDNNGLVTAVTEGTCTITATNVANTSLTSSCSVTVTASSSLPAGVLYNLSSPFKGNGSSTFLDTGIKLYDVEKDWTIFLKFKIDGTSTTHPSSNNIISCWFEGTPYRGLIVRRYYKADANLNRCNITYGSACTIGIMPNKGLNGDYILVAIRKSGTDYQFYTHDGTQYTLNNSGTSTSVTQFSNNLILGACQDSSGNPTWYDDSTIEKLTIYDSALDVSTIQQKILEIK